MKDTIPHCSHSPRIIVEGPLRFYPWVMFQSAWYRRAWLCNIILNKYLSLSISLFLLQILQNNHSTEMFCPHALCHNTYIWKLWRNKIYLMTNIHYKLIIAHMGNYTVAYNIDIICTSRGIFLPVGTILSVITQNNVSWIYLFIILE